MTIRDLEAIFAPRSVAVIGASEKSGALGGILFQNLCRHFSGEVFPVNPNADTVYGAKAYPRIATLPTTPDFAIIVTPATTVAELIRDLGRKGTRGVCVVTAGPQHEDDPSGRWRKEILIAARQSSVRVVGPNCVGLQVPPRGLNASFAQVFSRPGSIGFVAQSGAVITSVLDWAHPRDIGFSHVVSLGDTLDVDFGDLLDYLTQDEGTDSILLYIEAVTNARKFLSAARAAARLKPVIVIKAGRHEAGAQAAASHTGALAGKDAVYDAAFRRAGLLRVYTLEDLFDTVETLTRARVPERDTLTILTNGGGVGVLAADELAECGGQLTELSQETIEKLNNVLPRNWSHDNPIDIIGDAPPERYVDALKVVLEQDEIDALLVLNCPTAIASSEEVARAVIETLRQSSTPKTILTSWIGDESVQGPRLEFDRHGIATYDTPEDAVHAFLQTVNYRHSSTLLLETPPSEPKLVDPEETVARMVITRARANNLTWLTEPQAMQVLRAYGIPVVETQIARTSEEAGIRAAEIGTDVAIKILSPDITHKSDVGGVALNIAPGKAREVADEMFQRVVRKVPKAHIEGFTVQPMVYKPKAHELIVGMSCDRQFGPVILFGQGGTAVELTDDKAIALPPLNLKLALDLIGQTRIYRLLKGYRDVPAANLEAIATTLTRLSQLIVDQPEIEELDINPLLADDTGVIALDTRIRISTADAIPNHDRLTIRPYPKSLERVLPDHPHPDRLLRPIRPADDAALHRLFDAVATDRLAVCNVERPHDPISRIRLTQIDYDREMVLVLVDQRHAHHIEALVALHEHPDRVQAELAMAIPSRVLNGSAAEQMLFHLLDYANARGLSTIAVRPAQETSRVIEFLRRCNLAVSQSGEQTVLLSVPSDAAPH